LEKYFLARNTLKINLQQSAAGVTTPDDGVKLRPNQVFAE
jgi:hypothetical protein